MSATVELIKEAKEQARSFLDKHVGVYGEEVKKTVSPNEVIQLQRKHYNRAEATLRSIYEAEIRSLLHDMENDMSTHTVKRLKEM